MKRTLTPTEAKAMFEQMGFGTISIVSIRTWTEKYELGRRIGGRWHIDYELFMDFLKRGARKWSKDNAARTRRARDQIALWRNNPTEPSGQ